MSSPSPLSEVDVSQTNGNIDKSDVSISIECIDVLEIIFFIMS